MSIRHKFNSSNTEDSAGNPVLFCCTCGVFRHTILDIDSSFCITDTVAQPIQALLLKTSNSLSAQQYAALPKKNDIPPFLEVNESTISSLTNVTQPSEAALPKQIDLPQSKARNSSPMSSLTMAAVAHHTTRQAEDATINIAPFINTINQKLTKNQKRNVKRKKKKKSKNKSYVLLRTYKK